MEFCSECGYKFTGEGIFCPSCGTRRPGASPVAPAPVAPVTPVAPVIQAPAPQPTPEVVQPTPQTTASQVVPEQKKPKSGFSVLLLGVILGAVIVGAIYFINDQGKEDTLVATPAVESQDENTQNTSTPEDSTATETTESTASESSSNISSQSSNASTATTATTDETETQVDASTEKTEVERESVDERESMVEEESVAQQYLFPTDIVLITVNDLKSFTAEEVRLLRNEIYARYGYTFTNTELQEYFEEKSWYHSNPDLNAQTFDNAMLNDIEFSNIEIIVEYEASLN